MDETKTQRKTRKPTRSSTPRVPETSAPNPTGDANGEWRQKALDQAWTAREMLFSACFSSVVGAETVEAPGAKVYVNSFIRDAGEPTDPVELILLQQLLMAHHRVAQLHARAEGVTAPEAVKVLNAAASRLLGEVRRLALAIRQYRAPVSPRQFSVVHQQNVVASGKQQVTYVDQSSAALEKATLSARNELEAEPDNTTSGFGGRLGGRLAEPPVQEPTQGRRRQASSALVG